MTTHGSRPSPQVGPTELWAAGRLGKRSGGSPEILFAQVREDAAVELTALAACSRPVAAFCIGSGGCTAFSLLAGGLSKLDVVDINPAQTYLLELKKAAFEGLSYDDMLGCITVDALPFYSVLRPLLSPEASAFWDQRQHLLAHGLNQCGIIERSLKRAMRLLLPLVVRRRHVEGMFLLSDLAAQRSYYRSHWDNWRWNLLFRWALSPPVMRLAYGRQFAAGIPAGFPRLMKQQIDAAFLDSPIMENGYLWQLFLRRYPPCDKGLPIYLQREHHAAVQRAMATVNLATADAAAWLENQEPGSMGFFALSNILEVTTPEYTARLAEAIRNAARPGALVCMRSIFPPRPDLLIGHDDGLSPDPALSEELERCDRSPFCRFIQVSRVNQ